MAVKILHKRSAVQFKNATGAQLELGELGLNYHESGPYLQCKDADGTVVQLGGVYITAAAGDAPGNPLPGKWWLRGDTLFVYNGTAWVEIAGGGGGGGGGSLIVVGGDGIEASTIGTTVTISAALDTNRGLEFVGDAVAVKLGTGLAFDANGNIECTISGGLSYKGTVDVTSATLISNPSQGDLYANTGDGNFSTQWAGVTSNATTATDANPGDWMIYQGTEWDHIPVQSVGTDLDIANRDATDLDVTSSTGDDVTIPAATTALAGLMTAGDKTSLDALVTEDPKQQDLGYTPDGDNAGTVTITDGTDATIPIATDTVAGLFTGAEKQKLDGLNTNSENAGVYLSRTVADSAAGKIDFNAGMTAAGALSSYTTGINLQYVGSGVADIAAWRSGANNCELALSNTTGDNNPTERMRLLGDGRVRFGDPNANGRIFIDSTSVTSGYDATISQTDTGLEFTATSNSRGFVFNTGNPATGKVEIKPSGLTYFNEGLRLEGGTIADGSIVGSINEGSGNYYTYLHGSSSSPCVLMRRYATSKGTFNGINVGTTSQSSTDTSGLALISTVSATDPVNYVNSVSFYCPVKAADINTESSSENCVFQVIGGTAGEVDSGNRAVKMRISRNGSIFAGVISSVSTYKYHIDGINGDSNFRRLNLNQFATINGPNPTSASNLCIALGANIDNKNSIYCDNNSGKDRVWFNGKGGASYYIKSRTGGEQLDAIVLDAASITANGKDITTFTPVDPGVVTAEIPDATATVKSLQPHATGFDATQLETVLPGAFSTNEVVIDADENTTETVTSYNQQALIPILTKALQEALERIETLEAQVNQPGG